VTLKDLARAGRTRAALAVALLCWGARAEARVTRYLTGNPADVSPPLSGPAHDLGGGGGDVDAAIQWLIDEVRGCRGCAVKLDVLVLRSSGSNGYNDYIYAMNGVDSVETLVITSPSDSNRTNVRLAVERAEVVFFAGGDQCDYVRNFEGTAVETAVESVYARGGGVGGTSAGLAIQGEYVYDACTGSVTSGQALANPYHGNISFTYGFFAWDDLQHTIGDTHLVARDRMGRTMAFLARQIQDGVTAEALAVAVDEATSVVVDADGLATVMGDGPAYFVLADHAPETCRPGTPLSYSDYKIWKRLPGETFDLANRPVTGYYLRSVIDGVLSANPY
jgi:cyanophycinase-like exopeptidase